MVWHCGEQNNAVRQTDRHTKRLTDRQIDRQRDIQKDMPLNIGEVFKHFKNMKPERIE